MNKIQAAITLGTKSTDKIEIKRVYHKLAMQHHPDKHGGDDTKFKEINSAYCILMDQENTSLDNALHELYKTEEIAAQTCNSLYTQGSQLRNIDKGLDTSKEHVAEAKYISKYLARLKNTPFFLPVFKHKRTKITSKTTPTTPTSSTQHISANQTSTILTHEETTNDKLNAVSTHVSKLKNYATLMSAELEKQNEFLSVVADKTDTLDDQISVVHKQIKRL